MGAQAMEIVRLKDRLAEAEEGRRETHGKLAATRAQVHGLEDQITHLEQELDQSRSCAPPHPSFPLDLSAAHSTL